MRALLLLLSLALVACPGEDPVGPPVVDPTPDPGIQGFGASVKATLKVKRWRQISRDLESALSLPPEAVCNEAGVYPCSDLHAVPLGGASIDNGLFRPVDTLSVTSGLAFERFVLSACWERLRRDTSPEEDGDAPLVFTIDADGNTLDPADAEAQVTTLYRKLLARDPLPEEIDAVASMHAGILEDEGLNGDWAAMACFAVGTTTEGLMY